MDRRRDKSQGVEETEPDQSHNAKATEPDMPAPVPKRRAILKAAASTPVILTLMAGPVRAEYDDMGVYHPGESFAPDCEIPPPDPPRYNPEGCPGPND